MDWSFFTAMVWGTGDGAPSDKNRTASATSQNEKNEMNEMDAWTLGRSDAAARRCAPPRENTRDENTRTSSSVFGLVASAVSSAGFDPESFELQGE